MGASSEIWIGWRGWTRDLAFAAVLGTALGLIGPFGTFVQAGPALRLTYWIGLSLAVAPIYGLGLRAASALDGRWRLPGLVWMVGLSLVAAVPVALISSTAATAVWPFLRAMPPLGWLAQSAAVSLLIVAPYGVASRRLAPFAATQAPAHTSLEPPAILKGRRDLICLRMEDHYVRVYTPAGSELAHLSMRDAESSLGADLGLRVHRSWWVARAAVVETVSDGRNLRLRLTNGLEAPVSRGQVAALRKAGWLGGEGG